MDFATPGEHTALRTAVADIADMPRTSTGKIQKNVLRDRYPGYYAGLPEV